MEKLIEKIKAPNDVKNLNLNELEKLSSQIRSFLIESISKTGGHLASNLGVVELTLSIFNQFDLEKDKIVWDVGHQTYVHKILTGRLNQFDKLRMYEGMSGFPKRQKSKYDAFDTGHSSTSISAALGMARARDIKGEDNEIVAIIGDGALTGGMALEALNDVGYNKTKMIIVINDNQMSISDNVGGLSSYLNNLRMEPKYNKLKEDVNHKLNESKVGKNIAGKISKVKDSIKQLVVPSMLFEDMGLKYLGPIDGHNIAAMNEVFRKAKMINGPVIIHTITKKGKGYDLAEASPCKYHGISPFDAESGKIIGKSSKSYSKAFGDAMIELTKNDKNIVAITAAMPDGTGLNEYSRFFPNNFFDVGIAEEHAVTLAAGMACGGLKPVFAVYSTFLQRGFDQILHDVCIQNLPVVFAIDRAGLVGEDGETHQGIFDLSYLSIIPNMTIIAPKCLDEVKILLEYALQRNSPVAIRYPRGGDVIKGLKPLTNIKDGKWEVVKSGTESKVAIISVGKMTQHSLLAVELLKKVGVDVMVINATFVKPLDDTLLRKLSDESYHILTIEDNILRGGFGSSVLETLNGFGFKGKFKALGYENFIEQGNVDILYKEECLDAEGIKNEVLKMI